MRVEVLNGAGVAGLGRRAATDLREAGFAVIGTPGNLGTGATQTRVLHGPDRADSARTLAAAVPGAVVGWTRRWTARSSSSSAATTPGRRRSRSPAPRGVHRARCHRHPPGQDGRRGPVRGLTDLTGGLVGERDPAAPLLTLYDGTFPGPARVELSGATTANWVAKSANLLVDALGAPERVGLLLPLHWQTVALLLAAVATGATPVVGSADGCDVAFVARRPAGRVGRRRRGPGAVGPPAGCALRPAARPGAGLRPRGAGPRRPLRRARPADSGSSPRSPAARARPPPTAC